MDVAFATVGAMLYAASDSSNDGHILAFDKICALGFDSQDIIDMFRERNVRNDGVHEPTMQQMISSLHDNPHAYARKLLKYVTTRWKPISTSN